MEKIYGATERHDQLLVFGTGKAILIYGFGQDGESGFDYRHTFSHKPTKNELMQVINDHIDSITDERILWGYPWTVQHGPDAGKNVKVWLSKENQSNFKAKHDAALVYPDKVKFPMTYKISEDDDKKAIYEVFESIEELATFYLGGLAYIEECYNAGWAEKDAVDYDALLGGGAE